MKFIIAIIGFFILVFSPTPILAEEGFFDVFYDATALVQVNLKSIPRTEIVKRVQGNLDGKNNTIGDVDGDGLPDIETEIVSMNLMGSNPTLVEISLKNGFQDKKNKRTAEQLARCVRPSRRAGVLCPANSFFDIFIELRHTPFHNSAVSQEEPEVLTSCESIQLQGISKSLTDLSGHYTQRISGKIALCGRNGEPVGSMQIYFLKLQKHL